MTPALRDLLGASVGAEQAAAIEQRIAALLLPAAPDAEDGERRALGDRRMRLRAARGLLLPFPELGAIVAELARAIAAVDAQLLALAPPKRPRGAPKKPLAEVRRLLVAAGLSIRDADRHGSVLVGGGERTWFVAKRIETKNSE